MNDVFTLEGNVTIQKRSVDSSTDGCEKMARITMRDIGKAAGVSVVTVSKALAGKPGMSEETRKNICRIAEQAGYHYPDNRNENPRTRLDIGIMIPEKYFAPESFYAEIYKELVRQLAKQSHFGLLELITKESEEKLEQPVLMKNHHVDGIILLGEPNKDYYRMLAGQSFPVVYLDFYDEQSTADAVVGDNTYGCYRLTSHLIRNGHRDIGFIGNYQVTSSIMDRYLGFCRAMLSNKLTIRDEWVLSDRDQNGEFTEILLPEKMPTAFVCNCDLLAQRMIACLRQAGYRVPEDISVTGFDDYITSARNDSEISTFRVDTDSMVGHAIKLITERCAGLNTPFGRTIVSGQPVYRTSETIRK